MSDRQLLRRLRDLGYRLEERTKHTAVVDPATGRTLQVISRGNSKSSRRGRQMKNALANLRRQGVDL